MTILNDQFKLKPSAFLNDYILVMDPSLKGEFRGTTHLKNKHIAEGEDIRTAPPDHFKKNKTAHFVIEEEKALNSGRRGVAIVRLASETSEGVLEANIHAYWLAYGPNTTKRLFVSDDARYMFTATLDGCTFGVGRSSDVGVLITHANVRPALPAIEKKLSKKFEMPQRPAATDPDTPEKREALKRFNEASIKFAIAAQELQNIEQAQSISTTMKNKIKKPTIEMANSIEKASYLY